MKKINKFFRALTIGLLVVVLCLPTVACSSGLDREERPLSMALGTPDGVFNPFFSTSAIDGQVIALTQVSMLNSDKDGGIAYGENEPTVVKDYTQTENKDANDEVETTTYEFLIKNGIKFSDGTPLTIKDVLFNLYVYLDPVYTGSATIYSTDIVGLNRYRFDENRDDEDFSDDYATEQEAKYDALAIEREDKLLSAIRFLSTKTPAANRPASMPSGYTEENLKADLQTLADAFKKELESDWNGIVLESYKNNNTPAKWQIFLYQDGQMSDMIQYDEVNGKFVEDADGNIQFKNANDPDLASYLTEVNKSDDEGKSWAIGEVFASYFPTKEEEGKTVFNIDAIDANSIYTVINYWSSGQTVHQQFAAEAKSDAIKNNDEGIKSISGITTRKTSSFNGKELGSEHDVLQIKIHGVDPKAIWNFGFTVAPMHYYSNSEYVNKFYWDPIDPENSKTCFGFPKGDFKFFNDVINGTDKVKLPMGAGTYKAFSGSAGTAVTGDNFYNANMVNYERNEYFETMGSGINNAKIKYLRYKVVESDQIINSLLNGDIDYGEPNATTENQAAIKAKSDTVKEVTIKTSGYGYVGINPRFVPDVTVRRAIMKAMNTQIILDNYYKGGLAELIYRPMSTTSWAYPKTATSPYKNDELGLNYIYDASGAEIRKMIEDAGYNKGSDGIYHKNIPGFSEGDFKLELEFTIAGGTNDHPAYAMFLNAAEVLNKKCGGWKIKVVNSTTALSDMATGKLKVWAAAWSSTIDPDMYQVYHKDSQATSVKLWGYPQIKNGKYTQAYSYEWNIIQELSEQIDLGRSKLLRAQREGYYHKALDLVMQLAVEMPTYQRRDMMAYNSKVIDERSLTPENERTAYNGLTSRIWEVTFR